MTVFPRALAALVISLSLIAAGYLLGLSEPNPGFLGILIVTLVTAAVVTFLKSDARTAHEIIADTAGQRQVSAVVEREIARARRLGHPVAIIRAEADATADGAPDGLASITDASDSMLRVTDFAWLEDAAVHIVLPDATRQDAETVYARLRRRVPSLSATPSTVVFPEDGVTLGALADQLEATSGAAPARRTARQLLSVPVEVRPAERDEVKP